MEKRSHPAPSDENEGLLAENRRLREELERARREIEELTLELEEKALALANSRSGKEGPRPGEAETAPAASPPPRLGSLIRSALSAGASQAKMRIAFLEESLARQAERHGMQIAEMEAHFVQKLTEVAGGGDAAVIRVLRDRIVELERERSDPPALAQARATIGRLQAELEELREENRFLSAEVERWAALAREK